MTDDELKALVAENSRAIRELREESRISREQSDRRWEQYLADSEKARQEAKDARQEAEKAREQSDRRWEQYLADSEKARQEAERLWQEILVSRQETDRLVTNLNRELGRLGNKLGGYSESLIRPSLQRVLTEQLGMTHVFSPLSVKRDGEALEIDMVAHAGPKRREVYLAEIKSQVRQETFDQLYEHMRRLPLFFPEHRGKRLFGVLAAVDFPEDLKTQALNKGIYVATIRNDVFEIVPPDDFEPRAYGLRQA